MWFNAALRIPEEYLSQQPEVDAAVQHLILCQLRQSVAILENTETDQTSCLLLSIRHEAPAVYSNCDISHRTDTVAQSWSRNKNLRLHLDWDACSVVVKLI